MGRSLKFAAVQIALAAMMLRALLPAGWMPDPGNRAGDVSFVICTGHGPMIMNGANGRTGKIPAHHHDQSHDQGVCPYAAVAHLAQPALASLPVALFLAVPFVVPIPALPLARAYRHDGVHNPRDPPHFA